MFGPGVVTVTIGMIMILSSIFILSENPRIKYEQKNPQKKFPKKYVQKNFQKQFTKK